MRDSEKVFAKFMDALDLNVESITSRGMTIELTDLKLVRFQGKVTENILIPLEERIKTGEEGKAQNRLTQDQIDKLQKLIENRDALKGLIDESAKKLVDFGAVMILLKAYAVALGGIMMDGEVPKRLFDEQRLALKQCHEDCLSLLNLLSYLK
jgi:hypothetical protein